MAQNVESSFGRGHFFVGDNFNWDSLRVATLSVVDGDSDKTLASRENARNEFSNTLYHSVILDFSAVAGRRYELRAYWHFAPHAPRLTLRSVILK